MANFEELQKYYPVDFVSGEESRTAEAISQEEMNDISDIPELDDEFWKNARVRFPGGKERLTVTARTYRAPELHLSRFLDHIK